MTLRSLPPADVHAALNAQPGDLVDVRTPAEFAAEHAVGARNVPLDRCDAASVAAGRRPGTLYLICRSGVRSVTACERLIAAGVTDCVNVAEGTNGWRAAGLPIAGSGRRVFGVERQVRSIIGLGVLAGAILALTVDPWWALLSGFFGAGLLMAGITDLCPLATLVAAMPWNRGAGCNTCTITGAAPAKG